MYLKWQEMIYPLLHQNEISCIYVYMYSQILFYNSRICLVNHYVITSLTYFSGHIYTNRTQECCTLSEMTTTVAWAVVTVDTIKVGNEQCKRRRLLDTSIYFCKTPVHYSRNSIFIYYYLKVMKQTFNCNLVYLQIHINGMNKFLFQKVTGLIFHTDLLALFSSGLFY